MSSDFGGYRFPNSSLYVGYWNKQGRPQGEGHALFPDGTRYDGKFENGLFNGIGCLTFCDGAKYEGEFMNGWFHGYGTFWRRDGMKFEGEFRGGKINGMGLVTFKDQNNGFPKHEGFFDGCKLTKISNCPEIIQRVQKIAFMARNVSGQTAFDVKGC